MLFLLRPPQTWMPFERPRSQMDQDSYDARLQGDYASTQQVPAFDPSAGEGQSGDLAGKLTDLAELHRAGSLTDEEFSAAKAAVLSGHAGT